MKRVLFVIALCISGGLAFAQDDERAKDVFWLQQQNAVMTRTVALGNAANQCGLRSDAWANSFSQAFQVWTMQEARRLQLSSTELGELQSNSLAIYKNTMAESSCSSLAKLETLQSLDVSRDSLTLGYK